MRDIRVSRRVARHDRDAEIDALRVDRLPDRRELVVGHPLRERKTDREMRRGDAADGHVREHEVECKPRRPLEAQRGEDRERIGGGDQRPTADIEDAEVDAVGRADGDVVAVGTEIRCDVPIEERAIDFAEVAHGRQVPPSGLSGGDPRRPPRNDGSSSVGHSDRHSRGSPIERASPPISNGSTVTTVTIARSVTKPI